MSIDNDSPPPLIDAGLTQDGLSILSEKIIGADDIESILEKYATPLPDLEVLATASSVWHIEDWRRLERKSHGPTFRAAIYDTDCRRRVLLFPFGNTNSEAAAAYLECFPMGSDSLIEVEKEQDWACCAQFGIVMWNKQDPTIYSQHAAYHRFSPDESDWGFSKFYDIRKLGYNHEDRDRPLLENGETMITAYVRIVKDPTGVLWHSFNNYNSKKETGYVGLKNQGATCYMNSLLQSLYFTSFFRKAVYQIPTENDDPNNSIALALQRMYYQMEKSGDPVSTIELTRSFGWDSLESFMQHDVQEFNRVLQDNLEGKMKHTKAENALTKLFVGKMKSFIKCVNVDYVSSRLEDFWDIQLNVKGMKDLTDSFKDYVQVETLDGDNKYFAEGYGLQDAKKGVIFQSFPPVLHLQLKRFEYDMERDAMVKINDRHEFPAEIDLERFLADDADRSESHKYVLHGVLVHSGDLHGGHYYALLKPQRDGKWYKFDDDRVTPATLKEVFDENFGGANPPGSLMLRHPFNRVNAAKRFMNAYMLVYVRETRIDEILQTVGPEDIPSHVSKRIQAELIEEERKKKEKEELHLYLYTRTITQDMYQNHEGFDMTDLDAKDGSVVVKILKNMKYIDYKKQVAETNGLQLDQVRHWVMVNRQNKTIRADTLIGNEFDDQTVEQVRDQLFPRKQELLMYLEVIDLQRVDEAKLVDGNPNNTYFILFIKYFDVEKQTLRGATSLYLHKHEKIQDLVEKVQTIMDFDSSTQLKLFEEIKPQMIEPLRLKSTFHQAEIVDGDIVTVQKAVSESQALHLISQGQYATAPQFYDFLSNRITVTFRPKFRDQGSEFDLTLSKKMTYEQLTNKVAEHLKADQTHLRFTTVHPNTLLPKSIIKPVPSLTLNTILQPAYLQAPSTILAYEVLEVSLRELELKKLLKINFLPEGITKEVAVELLVSKNGNIEDAVNSMLAKQQLSADMAQRIRVYEAHSFKYQKELEPTFPVNSVQDVYTLYAEIHSEDDDKTNDNERYISVFHFQKEPSRAHGIPFKFVTKPGEEWKDTKKRLQKKTHYKDADFAKVKPALVQFNNYSKPVYLEDDNILYDMVFSEDLLGLDHTDKTNRSNRYGAERAIKISG